MEGITRSIVDLFQEEGGDPDEGGGSSSGHVDVAETSRSSAPANGEEHYPSRDGENTSSYRVQFSVRRRSHEMQDEAWSCLVVLVAFWFFAASMTLILGFYGSASLVLGPNYSRLIHANSFFVQEIRVNGDKKPGPMLYGFSQKPPLDVYKTWNETHHVIVQGNYHQEWMVWLNKGSVINVSYSIMNQDFSKLILVLVEGKTGLNEWIEEPSYPNSSLTWNNIHGTGSIEYKVDKDAEYYIAIGNLNLHSMEIYLDFRFNGILYNTKMADYKCQLQNDLCGVKLFLLDDNYAILTTPDLKESQSGEGEEWYARLSYGPRWLTYLVGSGGLTIVILIALRLIAKLQSGSGEPEVQSEHLPPLRAPLITQKDDDDSSCGSSYVSLSLGEEDEDIRFLGSPKGVDNDIKAQKSELYERRLCAICFDAPRDSFFLPCGHCATCFTCSMRISEETKMCPICRKKIRKVRKIFAV